MGTCRLTRRSRPLYLFPDSLPERKGSATIDRTAMATDYPTQQNTKAKIGYFCSYVPKELIHAFDRTPVRILPTAYRASEAEAFLPRNFCSLIKITLAGFLEAGSDLEGVVHSDSCDGLRRLNDIWRHYVEVEALHLLDLPRNDTGVSRDYYRHSLRRLSKTLEERLGIRLTAERLAASIQCYNEQRSLLEELDRHWRDGAVPTARYQSLRHTSITEDPLPFNARLREELEHLPSGAVNSPTGARVMLLGSLLTSGGLVQAIEESGARVVAEDSCSVGRELAGQVEVSTDVDVMLGNLAAAYLAKPPCPRMRDFPRRLAYLSKLATDHEVDGVVAFLYKFCDLFMSEYPVLRRTLLEMGVPVLLLEDEGEATLSGQHRTRLEAFLEVLQ
jgi:benzoyl-CoA reductase subunit C